MKGFPKIYDRLN